MSQSEESASKNNQTQKQKMIVEFFHLYVRIYKARIKAVKSVNSVLIDFFYNVGGYIFNNLENAEWGVSVVKELPIYNSDELQED